MSSSILRIFCLIALSISLPGCPGTSGDNNDDSKSKDPPAEVKPKIMHDGVEIESMMQLWREIGESPEHLEPWLEMSYTDNTLKPCLGWHIRETGQTGSDTFDLDVEAGSYFIQGFGGNGISELVIGVTTEEWVPGEEYYAESPEGSTVPMVEFELEQEAHMTVHAEYTSEPNPGETSFYLWVLYFEEDQTDNR